MSSIALHIIRPTFVRRTYVVTLISLLAVLLHFGVIYMWRKGNRKSQFDTRCEMLQPVSLLDTAIGLTTITSDVTVGLHHRDYSSLHHTSRRITTTWSWRIQRSTSGIGVSKRPAVYNVAYEDVAARLINCINRIGSLILHVFSLHEAVVLRGSSGAMRTVGVDLH